MRPSSDVNWMILLTLSQLLHSYPSTSTVQFFTVASSVAVIRQTWHKKAVPGWTVLHFLSTYMYYIVHGKIMWPFMVYSVPLPPKCLPGQYSLVNNVPSQSILSPLEQGWELSSATLVGGKTSSFLEWPYKPHRLARLRSIWCSWHTKFFNLCRVSLSVLTWGKKSER